jgi:hypothetical protein
MSEDAKERLDLESIRGPSTSPPSDPDSLTGKAIKDARKRAKTASPTDRIESRADRHIEAVCAERDWLKLEYLRVQTELGWLRPAHAREHQKNLNNLFTNALATILLAGGGALVSGAGYFPAYKEQILWGGTGALACGVLAIGLASIVSGVGRLLSRDEKERG